MDIKESKIHQLSLYKERHPWEVARLSVVGLFLAEILKKFHTPSQTILDFGCGDAYVIHNLSKICPNVKFMGVDSAFTSEQIQYFSSQLSFEKCRLFQNLDSVSDKSDKADIVLLLDVLEHIEDDIAVLSSLMPHLNPGGYILITVPAFHVLFCSHDRWLGHYRRYTKGQLCEIIVKLGLEVQQSGYFFSGLVLPRLYCKLLESIKIVRNQDYVGIGEWTRGEIWGNIIKSLLVINAKVDIGLAKYNLSWFGLSVFAICKK